MQTRKTQKQKQKHRTQRRKTQRQRKQRGGNYNDPAYATTETIGGIPVIKNGVAVLGNRVLSLKDFKNYVERGDTDQLDPNEV